MSSTILSTFNLDEIKPIIQQLFVPATDSHKGQNGRVLVIGGSELFHSSLIWAATMASKVVDMVHVASPAETNERLVREYIKKDFLDGIVVPWSRVEEYIAEDDVILIGPGMPRPEGLEEGELPTNQIVNDLVATYPDKKWVIDGGALQTIDLSLVSASMILTPHAREYERLQSIWPISATVLLKGKSDVIYQGGKTVEVRGGNAGMTKGGTGDVLAGLVAALYAKNDSKLTAQAASIVAKRAGEELFEQVGHNYSATDLLGKIPQVLRELTL